MTEFDSAPTVADFGRSISYYDWPRFIAELPLERRQCWDYAPLFFEARDAAQNAGDELAATACAILGTICFFNIQEHSADEPFGPTIARIGRNVREGRPPGEGFFAPDGMPSRGWVDRIVYLRVEHYDALRDLVPTLSDPELRARVADIVWLVRRHFPSVQYALDAYLESAQVLEPASWPLRSERLERAIRLGYSLGPANRPRAQAVLDAIEADLQQFPGGDATYQSAALMEVLQDLRIGGGTVYGPIAEVAARRAEVEDDWDRAERYWNFAIKWHRMSGNAQADADAMESLAQSHASHADAILNTPNRIMPNAHAAHWLEEAVQILRALRDQIPTDHPMLLDLRQRASIRAEELHRRLLQVQERSVAEMPYWGLSEDFTEGAAEVQNALQGKPFLDALRTIAYAYTPSNVKEICRSSGRTARGGPLWAFLSQVRVGATGRTTAIETPNSGDSNPQRARKRERRRVRMIEHSHWLHSFVAQGVILPGLAVINDEHGFFEADLLPMLSECEFVPPGREVIFARGLCAGAQFDWAVAAHLLVPQIENSLRRLLIGFSATPPPDVSQGRREWGLQEFLNDPACQTILINLYGDGLIYDIRALLTEKFGGSVRPLIEHGLLDDQAFNSPFAWEVAYLWWLTLRLCFDTLRLQVASSATPSSAPSV